MKKRISYFCYIALNLLSGLVMASEFKLNNIKIVGLQKVDEGVVLNALPLSIGEIFNTKDTGDYIKSIYKTGYFKDITINKDKNDIVIYVKEKPSISSIKIIGNDSLDTELLNKALGSLDIKEGGIYDEFTTQKITQELEQQYLSQGKYAVKIKAEVNAQPRNRVALVINISEGKVAKISQIRIIGNKNYTESELLTDFSLTEGGMISWFTLSDRYSKQKLTGDLEKLKSFYLNKGYLNFKITDAQIALTPDKKSVYITIQIDEGGLYKIGKVNVGGKYANAHPELAKLITVKSGENYSAQKVADIETAMLNELGRSGYSYAKVDINKNTNDEKKIVDISFFITPANRVYVRRISFSGNTKTQDVVLRRELLQMEGAFISRDKIELSKQRLYQLGYIKDINVETVPVQGSRDQVDLKYTLGETSTGHFNGGVGYSEAEGIMFNLGLSQDNFVGTGKSLSVDFTKSPAVISSTIGYFDPYFTIDGIGLGYNVYFNKSKLSALDISNYRLNNFGFDLSLRIPFSLYDVINFSLGAQNKEVKISDNAATEIKRFINYDDSIQKGTKLDKKQKSKDYNLFPLGASWKHSKLDRVLLPTDGWVNQIGATIAVPGSDLQYYTVYNITKYYKPIYNEFIFSSKLNLAYGDGFHKKPLPFFDHYYAGGMNSVRGFVQNSLGPRDSNNDAFGGNALVVATAELFLPKLFASNAAWRPSLFIDAGNVYNNKIEFSQMRIAGGIGVQWLSPLGPLSLSYALPIRKFKSDDLRAFNFGVGSNF